jgi:hypothetical protein
VFNWFRRLVQRQKPEVLPSIATDETGISLTVEGHSRAIPWRFVSRIAAFKQDLHSYDRIVLLLEVDRPTTEVLVLPEDCPGFSALFGPMEQELGIDPSWYLEIMTPVFEATPTVLYLRDQEP